MSDTASTPHEPVRHQTETEPLLGNPGSVAQSEDASLWHNLFLGTGFLAQIGLFILAAVIWTSVLRLDFTLFSLHPLFNSVGVVLLFESALLLQPTHTPRQKRFGAVIHSILNGISILLFIVGLIAIVLNKNRIKHAHFDSPHAILGLITYICLLVQAKVGFAQFYTPKVFGSVERAKSVYKYHRVAGYAVQILLVATVLAATRTTFALGPLHLRTWQVAVAISLVIIGVFPRIKKEKFRFNTR